MKIIVPLSAYLHTILSFSMNQEIYILDMIGTFACAIYGSFFAIKKRFDLLGIMLCAFLTAIGGGTIREVLSNRIPFYYYDMNYIYVIIIGCLFTIFIHEIFDKIRKIVLVFDSIGVVTFAFVGASKAVELNLGIFGGMSFALLTAIGGGILRDFVLNKTPEIMHRDFYGSVAILIGFSYAYFAEYMDNPYYANTLILLGIIVRFTVIYYKINLWKPNVKN
ncbi:MAG: TRIC cation channel family protein [Flavobacteriales bacterium]|nr:TRIC cation channel family protein [Flavobacteriales bacterium]